MNALDEKDVIPNYPRAGESIIALVIAIAVNIFLAIVLIIFVFVYSESIPSLEDIADIGRLEEFMRPIFEETFSPAFIVVSGVFSFGVWPFLFLRTRRGQIKSILRLNFTPDSLLIGILSGVAMVFVALGLEWVVSQVVTQDMMIELQNSAMIANYGGWRFGLGVLAMGVVTGFCEEVFFRGFMMRGFENSFKSPWLAIFLTSFIFAILHLNISIFVLAMVMGFLVIKTNSLYTSITCHATYNSIVLAITVFG